MFHFAGDINVNGDVNADILVRQKWCFCSLQCQKRLKKLCEQITRKHNITEQEA